MDDSSSLSSPSPHWQQHLQPDLTQRLTRPLQQPGVAGTQVAESILSRMQGMTSGLPVAAQLLQRQTSRERRGGEGVPIVYAQSGESGGSGGRMVSKSVAVDSKGVSGEGASSYSGPQTPKSGGFDPRLSQREGKPMTSGAGQPGETIIQRAIARPTVTNRTASSEALSLHPGPQTPKSGSFDPRLSQRAGKPMTSGSSQPGETIIQRAIARPTVTNRTASSEALSLHPGPQTPKSGSFDPRLSQGAGKSMTSGSSQPGETIIQRAPKRPTVQPTPRPTKTSPHSPTPPLPYSPTPSKTPTSPTLIQRSPSTPPLPHSPTPKMKTPPPIIQRSASDSDQTTPQTTEDQSLDIEDITDQVQQRLVKRMSVERERRGLTGW